MAGCRPQHTARWASAAASGCTSQLFWYFSSQGLDAPNIELCHAEKGNVEIAENIEKHPTTEIVDLERGIKRAIQMRGHCISKRKSSYFAQVLQNTSLSTTFSDALISSFPQSWRTSPKRSLVFHVSYPVIVERGWNISTFLRYGTIFFFYDLFPS